MSTLETGAATVVTLANVERVGRLADGCVRTQQPALSDGGTPPSITCGRLLAGMVHQGFGIEALCFFLSLARDALLDLVIQLDLPTPPDVAFRPRGGTRAWTQDDYGRLFQAWEDGWRCGAISETLGRSKSSVWAKARRLGLPKRDRGALLQPELIAPPRTRQLDLFPRGFETPAEAWPPPPEVREWKVRGTTEDITVSRKRDNEALWTRELCDHVERRFWSGQKNKAIARDLGISLRAITSMRWRMQIPKLPRDWLRDGYCPDRAARHIAAMGYVKKTCKTNTSYTYWLLPRLHTRSRRDIANGHYVGEY